MSTQPYGDVVIHLPEEDSPGYAISFISGGWMPGIYDSVESALKGAHCCFHDEGKFVKEIQQPINFFNRGNRLITIGDMDGFIKEEVTK